MPHHKTPATLDNTTASNGLCVDTHNAFDINSPKDSIVESRVDCVGAFDTNFVDTDSIDTHSTCTHPNAHSFAYTYSRTPQQFCQQFCPSEATLLERLDVEEFIARFGAYFARDKGIELQGDRAVCYAMICELDSINLPITLPKIHSLHHSFTLLHKNATLSFYQLSHFARQIAFFHRLQSLLAPYPELRFSAMIAKLHIPQALTEAFAIFDIQALNAAHDVASAQSTPHFTHTGFTSGTKLPICYGMCENIDRLSEQLDSIQHHIKATLNTLLQKQSLAPYLVDKQIHFLYDTQTLLLKAGYTRVLQGSVLDRTQGGFFYVLPNEIARAYEKEKSLQDMLELEIQKLCAHLSQVARVHLSFLRYMDKQFDLCDMLFARVRFAKEHNLQILLPYTESSTQSRNKKHKPSINERMKAQNMEESRGQSESFNPIVLQGFCHPILHNPTPINIDFRSHLLLLTGVNAGGKTMLLKSILTAALFAKYLIPMKIHATASKIPYYKHISAIISNPQNSKNDISTFAGRIMECSTELERAGALLGIDEIELGTDADEAASLYKVIIEVLLERSNKLIITTHHKRLAALLAKDSRIQLSAAVFDMHAFKPTFTFLHGSIGKSYAFESAQRYGIPEHIITQAKTHYGNDKERLNALIEKSTNLELGLQVQKAELEREIQKAKRAKEHYDEATLALEQHYARKEQELESTYHNALNALKAQAKTAQDFHKNFNAAHKILQHKPTKPNLSLDSTHTAVAHTSSPKSSKKPLRVGDQVCYGSHNGVICRINGTKTSIALESGMRVKASLHELTLAKKSTQSINLISTSHSPSVSHSPRRISTTRLITTTKHASPSLDLHGLRRDEAQDLLHQFISDSLIAGFDEVCVYHGIGTGVLAAMVKEVLASHPSVRSFTDAPPNMGGMGATLVRL